MEFTDSFSTVVTSRIRLLLTDKKVSVNRLSEMFGMNQSTLNKQIKGDTPLPIDTLGRIIELYPDVSMEWLLRGEGDMKKGFINQMIGRISSCGDGDVFQQVNSSNNDEHLKEQIAELKAEKERLLSIIEKLTQK